MCDERLDLEILDSIVAVVNSGHNIDRIVVTPKLMFELIKLRGVNSSISVLPHRLRLFGYPVLVNPHRRSDHFTIETKDCDVLTEH